MKCLTKSMWLAPFVPALALAQNDGSPLSSRMGWGWLVALAVVAVVAVLFWRMQTMRQRRGPHGPQSPTPRGP